MEVKNNELYWAKTKTNATIPTKNVENAGYDIYACFDEDYIIIPAFRTKLIPTGIASAFTEDYYMQIEERGSTGSKGIKKSAGVIDSGYRGEWFIPITNTNNRDLIISKLTLEELIEKHGIEGNYMGEKNFYILDGSYKVYLKFECVFEENDLPIIYPYSKGIAQAVMHVVPKMEEQEISYDDLLTIPSKRGTGKLGSSGK